ncbi:DEAD/DEAH box RNA helicase [Blastocystis sp. ATCC 50177/Nand II]|uniref:DEAD/DEAH box RNA helicase n=1 Tax=Blastocystis sp. subtype 1 (strain ATCC 50177 / NandII) TaxID=478820 RepID=A0A196SCC4_BLAHN|nr:DEAD/DEAH box RNA helicase [Blastocystis sp. ATCC 50177/Nand II]
MTNDFIMTIPDDEGEDNMVFKGEESSDEEIGKQEAKKVDFSKGFVFDGEADTSSSDEEEEQKGKKKSSRLQPNSRQYKLEERINKKRKEIMERQKDVDEETKTLADEEGDLQDTEDVIKSVKTIMEGKNEKLPSREEFFDTSAQPAAEIIPRSFNQLHLSRPLLRAINELGFSHPTPIQARCIPLALAGRDICAAAKTGSGKTAAYLLPVLERLLYKNASRNLIRVLVVTPTRELASQVYSIAQKLCKFTPITCSLVVGGLPLDAQAVELKRRPDIVVCTPGRMIDHVQNTMSVDLDDVEVVILDEADRLLELGFTDEIHQLLGLCPVKRQTLLFSATMTDSVSDLISLSLKKPARVFVDPVNQVVDKLVQEFIRVKDVAQREPMLVALLKRQFTSETIIFCEKKSEAHRLQIVLGLLGLHCAELHGDLNQTQRLQALDRFAKKEVDFLLATDVAARGLDIKGVKTVINLHMPQTEAVYIHRVGRTARAGHSGRAVTFVEEDRRMLMKEFVKRAVEAHQQIKTRVVNKACIDKYSKELEALKKDIDDIYEEERTERELNLAQREAQRADNLIKHEDEIKSRRKRTWFQSEKAKKDTKAKEYAAKRGKKV